uniref:FTP domain-containing protein n=1 Tax=Macrostomum lignano TaxID=282301 RepID=A0A1I8J542_9PLAT
QEIQLIECRQSSTFGGAECVRAIDGNTNQDYHAGSCTHTEAHQGWLELSTLPTSNRFASITEWTAARRGSTTFLSTSMGNLSAVYRGEPFAMKNFNVDRIEQLAFDSCSQSSTSYGGVCDRAIDGNINVRATFTGPSLGVVQQDSLDDCLKQPSLEPNSSSSTVVVRAQLPLVATANGPLMASGTRTTTPGRAPILRVRTTTGGRRNYPKLHLYRRFESNCCSDRRKDFLISVGGHECAFYRSDDHFSARNFECNAYGEVVRIDSHKAEPLILCEVEVAMQQLLTAAFALLATICSTVTGDDPGSCANQKLFSLAEPHSLKVPQSFKSVQAVGSELQCSLQCRAQSGVCFGFYWQEASLSCQLFSIAAFFSKSLWQPSAKPRAKPVDVFTKLFDLLTEAVLTVQNCSQISTFASAVCGLAIDGNTNQNFHGGSCAHTEGGKSQWWQADLAQQFRITAVRIFNRQDCCAERLNKFTLLVDDVECARVDVAQSFSIKTVSCLGYGSRVRLVSRLRGVAFSLCEVELLGFPVSPGGGRLAGRLLKPNCTVPAAPGRTGTCRVPGSRPAKSGKQLGHCLSTAFAVRNRVSGTPEGTCNDPGSCANQKLFSLAQPHSLTVPQSFKSVLEVVGELQCSLQCRAQSGVCFGFYWQEASLSCQLFSIAAFFSKSLWQPSDKPVDVFTKYFDSPAESVLPIRNCSQISTLGQYFCGLAIDGNKNQHFSHDSCTHTDGGDFQWWQADLAQQSRTTAVRIFNRQDCCAERLNKLTLLVDDVECARVDVAQSFSIKTVSCLGYGSRVRLINRLNTYVSLCEVEVLVMWVLRQASWGLAKLIRSCRGPVEVTCRLWMTHCLRASAGALDYVAIPSATIGDAEKNSDRGSDGRRALRPLKSPAQDREADAAGRMDSPPDQGSTEPWASYSVAAQRQPTVAILGKDVRLSPDQLKQLSRTVDGPLWKLNLKGTPMKIHSNATRDVARLHIHSMPVGRLDAALSTRQLHQTPAFGSCASAPTKPTLKVAVRRPGETRKAAAAEAGASADTTSDNQMGPHSLTVPQSFKSVQEVGRRAAVLSAVQSPVRCLLRLLLARGESVVPAVQHRCVLQQVAVAAERQAGRRLHEWWQADLAQQSRITAVRIFNRQDCCAERLNSFTLLVDDIECARVDVAQSFSIKTVSCLGYGSRVRLINRLNTYVSLCEVEVLGFTASALP